MLFNITELSNQPMYEQITMQLLQSMVQGEFTEGLQLPNPGHFARKFRVSKNTIERSYQYLKDLGVIDNRSLSGYTLRKIPVATLTEIIERIEFKRNLNKPNFDVQTRELQLAGEIQSGLLPKRLPQTEAFSIAAFTQPSKSIGGDFYDCFRLSKNNYGIVIADASGHGLPAALIISQIQAIIKTSLSRAEHLVDLISLLNRHLKENTSARNFVTLFFGIYNSLTGKFIYINAGHNMPLLIRNNGKVARLATTAPALGLTTEFNCRTAFTRLDINEVMVLYTDGITETMNTDRSEYSEDRLENLIVQKRDLNPEELMNAVRADLEQFCPAGVHSDDQTLMILKRHQKMVIKNR